jgi:zinc D-Ala-D-Ala carboxypeptidase
MPDGHWRWPNFEAHEFACSHCGEERMRASTLDRLQTLRTQLGRPMIVTSGYRCRKHPTEAKKASGPGAHAFGCAVDIRAIGTEAYDIVRLAMALGFTGIGISQRAGHPRFVHLDDATSNEFGLVRPTMWSY